MNRGWMSQAEMDELVSAGIEQDKQEIAKLRADNASKNGSLKAMGEQLGKLQRAVLNRDKQLIQLRALLREAISLEHHHAITDRTYWLRQKIDKAIGKDHGNV